MNTNRRFNQLSSHASRWTFLHLALLMLVASAPLSAAATVTWGGTTGAGSNTLWSNNLNWDGAVLPATGDIVVFPAMPTIPGAYTVTYDVALGLSLAQINIYTPASGSWTVTVTGSPSPLVPLALNIHGPTIANVSAPMDIVTGTTLAVAVDNLSTLNLLGVISGPAGGFLLFSGPFDSTMAGSLPNTFLGTTTVQAGMLNLSKTGGATSIAGPLMINNGAANVVTLAGAANAIANSVEVTVASGATLDLTNAAGTDQTPNNETIGALLGAGNVVLGAQTLGVALSNTPTTFSGVVSGTGGLRKSGTGTQRLSGANSYTGATTVTNGALTVVGLQAASAVALNLGTLKIADNGLVGALSSTSATGLNALVIGNEPASTNTARSGDLNLSGAGANTSRLDVFTGPAAANSTLTVTGTVNLTGATLRVNTASFTPAVSSVWTIIDNDLADPVVGTFLGLAEGATVTSVTNTGTTFTISYLGNPAGSGNDVTLTVVMVAADSTPPTVTSVAPGGVTATGANVSWTTNEPSDSQVEYGTTTAYGSSTTLATALVTSHTVAVSGLSPSTVYHYRVLSSDASGNLTTSADSTFTTPAGSGSGSATAGSTTAGTTGAATTPVSTHHSSCGFGGGGLAILLTLGLFAARRKT